MISTVLPFGICAALTISSQRWESIAGAAFRLVEQPLLRGAPTSNKLRMVSRGYAAHLNCLESLLVYTAIVVPLVAARLHSRLVDHRLGYSLGKRSARQTIHRSEAVVLDAERSTALT
jgi:hypothetical protein